MGMSNPRSPLSPQTSYPLKHNDIRLPSISTQVPGLSRPTEHHSGPPTPPSTSQSWAPSSKRRRSAEDIFGIDSGGHHAKRQMLSHSPPQGFPPLGGSLFPNGSGSVTPREALIMQYNPTSNNILSAVRSPERANPLFQLPPIREHPPSIQDINSHAPSIITPTLPGSKVDDPHHLHGHRSSLSNPLRNERTLPPISTIDLPRQELLRTTPVSRISPQNQGDHASFSNSNSPDSVRKSATRGPEDPMGFARANLPPSLAHPGIHGHALQPIRRDLAPNSSTDNWYKMQAAREQPDKRLTPPYSAITPTSPSGVQNSIHQLPQDLVENGVGNVKSNVEIAPAIQPYHHSDRPNRYMWNVPTAPEEPDRRKRRGNLPKESTAILNEWFCKHLSRPYPTEEEKQGFQTKTGLTMSQISNWFINARRRRLPKLMEKDAPNHQNSTEQIQQADAENICYLTASIGSTLLASATLTNSSV